MLRTALGLFVLLIPLWVCGAELSLTCPEARGCFVVLRGEIVQGDAGRLRSLVVRNVVENRATLGLVLDSNGGSVVEAFRMIDVVREAMLDTSLDDIGPAGVKSRRTCVSACALVFMAGANRWYSPWKGDRLGFHRPYFRSDSGNASARELAEAQGVAMRRVRDFLFEEGVPANFVDAMLNRASNEVLWVSSADWNQFRRRAAWFEELLISKCGLPPRLRTESLLTLTDAEVKARATKQAELEFSAMECGVRIQVDARSALR